MTNTAERRGNTHRNTVVLLALIISAFFHARLQIAEENNLGLTLEAADATLAPWPNKFGGTVLKGSRSYNACH